VRHTPRQFVVAHGAPAGFPVQVVEVDEGHAQRLRQGAAERRLARTAAADEVQPQAVRGLKLHGRCRAA
jgi:hypothetical protein